MSYFTLLVIGQEKQLQPYRNIKWDWYLVGGIWSGFLKTKEGKEGAFGCPGVNCGGCYTAKLTEIREPKIRTHILAPGMDLTICGTDAIGDDLAHDKPPDILPRGKRHRVTCEHCQRIIDAVKDHISSADV